MDLPKPGETYLQERRGINAVQSYVADQGGIWRETGTGDVGIDGQIEFVDGNGFATGRLVAVQVKAGPAYFTHKTEAGWKFYPEAKHKRYWESFPLPVLLVLHDPASKRSYWTDIRQTLRTPGGLGSFIEVAEINHLQETPIITLFENARALSEPFTEDLHVVMVELIKRTSAEASFPLSYFDMFVHGLTNIARSIFFSMDVVMNAVEFNIEANEFDGGIGIGGPEQDFVFGFVRFLLAQDLAQIDYSDCLIDWVDRKMQPQFVAPLTSRGRALVDLIFKEERKLMAEGRLPDEGGLHVAQEGFVQMVLRSYESRFPRIFQFQNLIISE